MKKSVSKSLFILLLLIGSAFLTVFFTRETDNNNLLDLSDATKIEIENSYLSQMNLKIDENSWHSQENPTGIRYYGDYDGFSVIFDPGQLTSITEIEIADEIFIHSCSFVIYAYNEGEFFHLKDAYEKGLITKESITKISNIHKNFKD